MKLDNFSRFVKTEPTIVDGYTTYGPWTRFSFLLKRPSEENIKNYAVTSATEGRPDRIAQILYGTPYLDWVLLAFNKVRDPFGWPAAGDVIEYPVDTVVFPELLS